MRVLALVLALLAPLPAAAHGGPPTFEMVVVDPTDPMRLFAATNFGTALSTDGGATWGWICPRATALEYGTEDPILSFADDGALLMTDRAGVWRSPDGCDWSRADPPGAVLVAALGRAGSGVHFAGTASESGGNVLLRSIDDARTWSPVFGPETGSWFESVTVAPSDPMRVYAIRNRPPADISPWEITSLRSDDGGDTWTPTIFADHAPHEWRLYFLAVDPTDPDRALARTQNLYPGEGERLMLTEDGGSTWTEVLRMVAIQDAAFAPDGARAWVGGPVDGLWRSDDGGRTFAAVYPTAQVRCTPFIGELWICADDYADDFGLGRSRDGGETFERVARLRSISRVLECPAGSTIATVCPGESMLLSDILAMVPDDVDAGPPTDGGPVAPDAGVIDADGSSLDGGPAIDGGVSRPSGGGCACSAGKMRSRFALGFGAAIAVAIVAARRRPR